MSSANSENPSDGSSRETMNSERYFTRRLTLLSEVTNELSKQKTSEALYRRVIELGHTKLDFDRLTLFFISADRKTMRGSFGVDTAGNITDERGACFPVDPASRNHRIISGECRLLRYTDAPLYLNGQMVGKGTRIVAGLWDGEQVIGFMSFDNLLRKSPFSDRDEEFIHLFATAVGHLCSLKKGEEENRNLQTQLMQAQKMESVGRLAGGVAHDFNNMLSVIIGLSELVISKLGANHSLFPYLDEIYKAAQHSANLTSQLLAFARKQVASPKPVDLNAAIPELLKMLSRLIGTGIEMSWQPGSNLGMVQLDTTQLDQVLTNLCINARDAIGDQGGRIEIATRNIDLDAALCSEDHTGHPGKYVLLTVSDNGNGMDENVKSKLFEPFFTTKELGRGTGLGLATVFGIIKQNNGIIHVESKPGCGTSFLLYFPRLITPNPVAEQPSPRTAINRSVRGTVLVVEDEPTLLDLNRRNLELLGFTVLCAPQSKTALEIAESYDESIDLLLTDVTMPGMNGYDLARKIASLRPGIKLIFTSGFASEVITDDIITNPGLQVLQKPFSREELGRRVYRVLGQE